MRSSVNIPLADVPLREVLGERLGVPVFVDNDATVAALAEAHDCGATQPRDVHGRHRGRRRRRHRRPRLPRRDGRRARARAHAHRRRPADGTPQRRERFPQPGSLEALASGTALDALGQRARLRGRPRGGRRRAGRRRRARARSIALLGHRLGARRSPTRSTPSTPRSSPSAAACRPPATCCSARARDRVRASSCPASAPQTEIRTGPQRRARPACAAPRCWPDRSSNLEVPTCVSTTGRRERTPGGADRGRHEHLAGPDPPLADRRVGELQRMIDEESLRGVDVQPGDLREGDPRLRRLRRADRAARPRGRRRAARSTARSSSRTSRTRADVLRRV